MRVKVRHIFKRVKVNQPIFKCGKVNWPIFKRGKVNRPIFKRGKVVLTHFIIQDNICVEFSIVNIAMIDANFVL